MCTHRNIQQHTRVCVWYTLTHTNTECTVFIDVPMHSGKVRLYPIWYSQLVGNILSGCVFDTWEACRLVSGSIIITIIVTSEVDPQIGGRGSSVKSLAHEHEDWVPNPEPLEELGVATYTCDSDTGAAETGSCLGLADSHPGLLSKHQVPVRDPGSKEQSGALWGRILGVDLLPPYICVNIRECTSIPSKILGASTCLSRREFSP